jgi:hypothetical protein
MNWLLIAGGAFLSTLATPQDPDMFNHTLRGERVLAREVVCRNMWGTPMLPDGKAGYSLIAPINPEFIAQSLIQPPRTSGPVFRPATVSIVNTAPVVAAP